MIISIPDDILSELSSGYKAEVDEFGNVLIVDEDEIAGFVIPEDSIKRGKYRMVLRDSLRLLEAVVEQRHARIN